MPYVSAVVLYIYVHVGLLLLHNITVYALSKISIVVHNIMYNNSYPKRKH